MLNLYHNAARFQKHLDKIGIRSAVIGGLAAILWGRPRLTKDVDFRILLQRDERARLFDNLPKNYSFLSADPDLTIRRRGYVFIQDPDHVRIDVLVADTDFDVVVVERAKQVQIDKKTRLWMCTPEDLIVYKLTTTRAYDVEDVKWTIRHQGDKLDDDHILYWLKQYEIWVDDATLVSTYRRLRGI
ncbi:MAG: nucleotidyltransferase [Chloroflexi bacterium]|nr:nucleotidyltransferase [Chloroflexota bacterium]